jgi:hypothetical protein
MSWSLAIMCFTRSTALEDLTSEPIAMIQPVRIDYQFGEYPDETTVTLNVDKESEDYGNVE